MATEPRPVREEPLTRRELDVLRWFHAGYAPADIAHLLGLSLHTVRDYLKEIRRKYGVTRSYRALQLAEAEGLFAQEQPGDGG